MKKINETNKSFNYYQNKYRYIGNILPQKSIETFEFSLIGQKSSDKSIFRNIVDSSKRRCHNRDEFALS